MMISQVVMQANTQSVNIISPIWLVLTLTATIFIQNITLFFYINGQVKNTQLCRSVSLIQYQLILMLSRTFSFFLLLKFQGLCKWSSYGWCCSVSQSWYCIFIHLSLLPHLSNLSADAGPWTWWCMLFMNITYLSPFTHIF